jgi:hypothetical protein
MTKTHFENDNLILIVVTWITALSYHVTFQNGYLWLQQNRSFGCKNSVVVYCDVDS